MLVKGSDIRGDGGLTLRLLVRLGSLDVLHSIRKWTGDRRGDPLLRIVWLDGAQGGLTGREGAVGTH
jgi:hypothetical protein